jgi:hypothetical protein
MPFLRSLASVRRVRTELGYSITCHASMYTGVRPDRHLLWFVWQRGPTTSPFRWLRPLLWLDPIDNLPMHVAATKVARRFARTSSWFGVPYVVHLPWRHLPELDVSERRLWNQPGYLDTAPTVFDLLRRAGLAFTIVGMTRGSSAGLAGIEAAADPDPSTPMTYLFAGDVDHVSHAHGQDSPEAVAILRDLDRSIERKFASLQRRSPEASLLVWSDHGHHRVQGLDPLPLLAAAGIDLKRHLHVIDTNFIRFWIPDLAERQLAVERLSGLGVGHVMTTEELRAYRCEMPDNRYGDVIFYVDLPHGLTRTIWGFGRRMVSAHGYLPDYPASDGVVISNRPLADRELILADVAPSLLELLGVDAPSGLDGASFMADAAGLPRATETPIA